MNIDNFDSSYLQSVFKKGGGEKAKRQAKYNFILDLLEEVKYQIKSLKNTENEEEKKNQKTN